MKDAVNAALSSLEQKLKQVISHSAGVADGSNQIYCTARCCCRRRRAEDDIKIRVGES
jgi:hypothetical protein